jgi:RNA polymerase sigma-70 factor (ECF subfamily)
MLMVANQEIAPDLQAKVGPSDLVQDTFLEAHRDFHCFQGTTREELLAWVRNILLHNLANVRRQYREAGKRQVQREVSLADTPLGQLLGGLTDPGESPSAQLIAQEQDEALEAAIDQLSEDHRQVIRWQKDEGCSFKEMARRMGRSPDAVRQLRNRALEQIAIILELPHERR